MNPGRHISCVGVVVSNEEAIFVHIAVAFDTDLQVVSIWWSECCICCRICQGGRRYRGSKSEGHGEDDNERRDFEMHDDDVLIKLEELVLSMELVVMMFGEGL